MTPPRGRKPAAGNTPEPDESGGDQPVEDHPTQDDTLALEIPSQADAPVDAGVPVEADEPMAATESVPVVNDVVSASDAEQRLARLEEENAALRAKLAAPAVEAPPRRDSSHRGRRWAAVALVAIGALLAPLGVVAHWADRTLTNTDRYLETVAPLADKPQIQSAIINRTTTAIMSNIDVSSVTGELENFLSEQGAPPRLTEAIPLLEQPLQNGVQTVVTRVVTRFVESDAFNSLWLQVNRISHEQIVGILEGDPDIALQLDDDGNLTLQLGPIIDVVKQQLVDAGIGIAASIPAINPTVAIAQADSLSQLRTGYKLLNAVGTWLPWVALAFLVAGVLIAPRRARMAVGAGLALVVGMLLLALGLAIGRSALLGALPAGTSGPAVEVLFNDIVRFMRISLRAVAVVGLFVAIIAFLAGGSAAALATRRSAASGAGAVRSWGSGRGIDTGAFGVWLRARLVPLRWVVAAIAVLVIVLADTPTAALVITTAIVALVVLGILQLLSTPPAAVEGPPFVEAR